MVILAAIAAALAVVLIARLAGGRTPPARWSSRPSATAGPATSLPEVKPIALAALRQQFHVLALGLPALPEEALEPGHQALINEVTTTLGRADLSPRYTPRRPQLLPQLIQSVNDSTASARSISRIIGSDPVLAVNLLRIANSPLYRFQRREVQSIERAVTLVGNDGIRQIISAALIQPVMNPSDGDGGRFSRLLWDHTLRMSLAAADHARSMEREDGFAAQLAALLRGLSVAMVVQATADAYARRPALQPSAQVLLQLVERCAAETAARIARHWELAPVIVQALEAQEQDGASSVLGRSLQLGELAASLSMLCDAGELPADEAEAQLALQLPAHVAGWLWKRVYSDDADADAAA
jgi:HD-like signal output (HDOD) protein